MSESLELSVKMTTDATVAQSTTITDKMIIKCSFFKSFHFLSVCNGYIIPFIQSYVNEKPDFLNKYLVGSLQEFENINYKISRSPVLQGSQQYLLEDTIPIHIVS